jgi:hypothetical protein
MHSVGLQCAAAATSNKVCDSRLAWHGMARVSVCLEAMQLPIFTLAGFVCCTRPHSHITCFQPGLHCTREPEDQLKVVVTMILTLSQHQQFQIYCNSLFQQGAIEWPCA